MSKHLHGKTVALLVDNGFEQSELVEPMRALKKAGAIPRIVSPQPDRVRGWADQDWGKSFDVDVRLEEAHVEDFYALVLPGGVMNPDHLRRNETALEFVRGFFAEGKPVAAICHGPWTLVDAGVIKGRHVTSYASIQSDLRNAGAQWTDEEVVVDNGLITSRSPQDLPAFNRKLVEEIGEGIHAH